MATQHHRIEKVLMHRFGIRSYSMAKEMVTQARSNLMEEYKSIGLPPTTKVMFADELEDECARIYEEQQQQQQQQQQRPHTNSDGDLVDTTLSPPPMPKRQTSLPICSSSQSSEDFQQEEQPIPSLSRLVDDFSDDTTESSSDNNADIILFQASSRPRVPCLKKNGKIQQRIMEARENSNNCKVPTRTDSSDSYNAAPIVRADSESSNSTASIMASLYEEFSDSDSDDDSTVGVRSIVSNDEADKEEEGAGAGNFPLHLPPSPLRPRATSCSGGGGRRRLEVNNTDAPMKRPVRQSSSKHIASQSSFAEYSPKSIICSTPLGVQNRTSLLDD